MIDIWYAHKSNTPKLKFTYLNNGQFWSTLTLNCPSVRASDFITVPPNSLFIIYNSDTIQILIQEFIFMKSL